MVYPREKKNWGQLGRTVVRKKWREWQLEYEMKLRVMNKKYLQGSILKQVVGWVGSWLEIGSNGLTKREVLCGCTILKKQMASFRHFK